MKQLDGFLIWLGIGAFVLFMALFSFYALSILLPVILVHIGISFLFNSGNAWYWNFKNGKSMPRCRGQKKDTQNPKIIDVEYEIIDDDKK